VIILCLPLLNSRITDNLLLAINKLRLAHLPDTTVIAMHLTSIDPFLPIPHVLNSSIVASTIDPGSPKGHWHTYLQNHPPDAKNSPQQISSIRLLKKYLSSFEVSTSSNFFVTPEYRPTSPSYSRLIQTRAPLSGTRSTFGSSEDASSMWRRYSPPEGTSQVTKRAMLVLTVAESEVSVEELFNQGLVAGNMGRHPEVSASTYS
jgi:hypothetical protein